MHEPPGYRFAESVGNNGRIIIFSLTGGEVRGVEVHLENQGRGGGELHSCEGLRTICGTPSVTFPPLPFFEPTAARVPSVQQHRGRQYSPCSLALLPPCPSTCQVHANAKGMRGFPWQIQALGNSGHKVQHGD